ncbi:GEM-like protein 4 [Syzygium oleosum]|uniref:GEM-like protein 4 n=1 Tax=Syzygium oleosum TaxID=219896 RepID=UPI0024BAD604|nr:GEM-like protein 4 [Syzygium oleosum]
MLKQLSLCLSGTAVRLSPGIRARVLQLGGIKKVFREFLGVEDGENLMGSCQRYFSTSAGPIAGLLFFSTEKVAFWSERSLKVDSSGGESTKTHYKVKVPISKIKAVTEQNAERPSQKYINIVTVDELDLWFMGFFNYKKALKHLGRAIHQE